MNKVSIIIPVHDGEKYISRTVKCIQKQSYRDIEIILVENHSIDRSYELCCDLARRDQRVAVLISKEKGTSFARRQGIEHACGDYIIFCDQDDWYVNCRSIEKMVTAIREDKTDVCQFGYYTRIGPLIKKRHKKSVKRRIISKQEFFSSEITGLVSSGKYDVSSQVWNKIYKTDLLKEIASQMCIPLYYAEDLYLNLLVVNSQKFSSISIRNEAYYIWNRNTGYSRSNKSEGVLFDEYESVKPIEIDTLKKHNCEEQILFNCHLESIYFYKLRAIQICKQITEKNEIDKLISYINQRTFIVLAKDYFRKMPKEKKWDELSFLCGDLSAEDFINYYRLV